MNRKKEIVEISGMLWQGNPKNIDEKNLEESIEYYHKKYGKKPEKILVNKDVNTKSYDGINVVIDKQMYNKTIFLLVR